MTPEPTPTSTKGSSLPPFHSCPACGFPDLPSIEPETLHLKVGCEAVAGFLLPDGRYPVTAGGLIFLMPDNAWTRYKQLCAHSEATARAMAQAACGAAPFSFLLHECNH